MTELCSENQGLVRFYTLGSMEVVYLISYLQLEQEATTKAAEQPKIYPLKAPLTKVCTKSTQRIGTLLINFTNTKDGAGRITGLTSKALIEASQTSNNDTPNKIGGKTILVLMRAD